MEKAGQIWVIVPMQMWLTSGNTLSLLYNLLSYLEYVYSGHPVSDYKQVLLVYLISYKVSHM